ncbi:MAG: hypothetical protein FJY97_19385 [candidate division Zixibacteria bacterium]|nr:hypothetical protein [candidate division Zixibacteria bacterium]
MTLSDTVGKFFSRTSLRSPKLWMALGLALGVWGAKLQALDDYSVDIPFEDEWHADAMQLFKPYEEGTLRFLDLFAPHNEHRIFFTRLWDLGWYILNGQWSPQFLMVVNAVLHSFLAVALWGFVERVLPVVGKVVLLIATGILIALPFSTATVLTAFQSQFYFLLLFSTLGLWLLASYPPFTRTWWGGVAVTTCAFFSVSSGLLGFAAAGVVLGLKYLRNRNLERTERYALGTLAGIFVIGYLFRVVEPAHERLMAVSVGAFLKSLFMALAWPHIDFPLLGLVFYAPFLALNILYVTRRAPHTPISAFLLGLGWWIGLNIAASAYMRGGPGEPPAVRYWDILQTGMAINVACLLYIPIMYRLSGPNRKTSDAQTEKQPSRKSSKPTGVTASNSPYLWVFLFGMVWLFVVASGLYRQGTLLFRGMLPAKLAQQNTARQHIEDFLASGDIAHLSDKGVRQTSFSGAPEDFAVILSDPTVRKLLPPEINPASPPSGWLARAGRSVMAWGFPITLLGLLATASGVVLSIQNPKRRGPVKR